MTYRIFLYPNYTQWFDTQTEKSKLQIEKRLEKIKNDDHFGHHKDLNDGLSEIKFTDGRRIYYTIVPVKNVILILGGSKNGQDYDIRKAKALINKAREIVAKKE